MPPGSDALESPAAVHARNPHVVPFVPAHPATDLATRMGRYVSPASPPGTRPEDYLAAVLVERRRRHELKLAGRPTLAPQPTVDAVVAAPERKDDAPSPTTAEPPAPEKGTGGFSLPG